MRRLSNAVAKKIIDTKGEAAEVNVQIPQDIPPPAECGSRRSFPRLSQNADIFAVDLSSTYCRAAWASNAGRSGEMPGRAPGESAF